MNKALSNNIKQDNTMLNYNQIKRKEEKQFIENLIFLMEDRKITSQQIVKLIGQELKISTFKNWRYRGQMPPLYYCKKIAEVFNVTLEEMTTIELYKVSK
jgi:hypothetical protein